MEIWKCACEEKFRLQCEKWAKFGFYQQLTSSIDRFMGYLYGSYKYAHTTTMPHCRYNACITFPIKHCGSKICQQKTRKISRYSCVRSFLHARCFQLRAMPHVCNSTNSWLCTQINLKHVLDQWRWNNLLNWSKIKQPLYMANNLVVSP